MVKGMKQYPISDLSDESLEILQKGRFFIKYEFEEIDFAILNHYEVHYPTVNAALDYLTKYNKDFEKSLFEILDNELTVVYTGYSDNPRWKRKTKPNTFIEWLKE
jgi:hypothetical protein